ncbi:class I SAM-dependent methyltransferase [Virgibacillus saliphilus]|uniref:class I SAM-dependent methyltransferase n=1 Tax=Virgibacillus saliphilus TaxID=2831674 RepID=UPI0021045392|nr:class I SAM-dependent methyltransferase [Virgibacillus sp. NKC19-3]
MDYSYLNSLAQFGVGGAHPGGLKLTRYILSKETLDATMSVLDVGCGTGQTAAYIAKQYQCHVIALDSSEIMLEKAKQRFSSLNIPVEVKQGDAEYLPFETSVFDIILCESVALFTDIPLTISEYKRVLKPNGVLLAIEMVLEKECSEEKIKPIRQFYGVDRILTESEWYTHFKSVGFSHITTSKYNGLFDGNDLQNAPDFSLSEHIDDAHVEVLEKHAQLVKAYRDILGFRIFRCR